MAVALAYAAGQSAPTVVAKGRGLLADSIISRAKDAGIAIQESPELAAILMQLDLDAQIPPDLYTAVAEVLAWVYRMQAQKEALSKIY